MNRKAKILAVSGILLSLLIASIVLVISTRLTSAQNWQDYMTLEYNTDNCLGICEAIFTIKTPGAAAIPLAQNDVKIWNVIEKGSGLTKEIEVYREETISYEEEVPDYGTCSYTFGEGSNATLVEYPCQTGSHKESRTRKEFLPFDFAGKTLASGETWRIRLIGYKKPAIGENNVEWLINFKGLQPPWAWWLTNYSYRRNNTINHTDVGEVKQLPVLINSTFGYGGAANRELVWCFLDVLPSTTVNGTIIFYYNSATDYRCVNGSDGIEFPKDVESGNGSSLRPRQLWDSSYLTLVSHLNKTAIDSTSSSKNGTATNVNWTEALIGYGVNLTNLQSKVAYGDVGNTTAAFTLEFWFKMNTQQPVGTPDPNTLVITDNDLGISINLNKQEDMYLDYSGGQVFFNSSLENLTVGKWYHVALAHSGATKANLTVNGVPYAITFSSILSDSTTLSIGHTNPVYTAHAVVDELRFYNKTLTTEEIRARYEMLAFNYSQLVLTEEVQPNATANESQADPAILLGIQDSLANASATFQDQQVYTRNSTGQALGRFDYVAVLGNQRWAFNYVTSGDPTSNFTYMSNMGSVLYVWENQSLTTSQITEQVRALINSTKL